METARQDVVGDEWVYRAIGDTAGDAVFVKDRAGRYLYVNAATARLCGTTPAAMIGTVDEAWIGAAAAAVRADDAAVMAAGEARTYEETLVINGVRTVLFTTKSPYRDRSGAIAGVIGITRDITAQRAAADAIEAERDAYAAVASTAPGALASFRIDADGRFSWPFATDAIEDILGVPFAVLAADPGYVRDRTSPEDRVVVEAALAASARDLTPFHCEYGYQHPTRGPIRIEVSSRPKRGPDGSVTWHGFVVDVTARHQTEVALTTQRELLARIAAASPAALFTRRRRPDGGFEIPYASEALREIFGLDPAVLIKGGAQVGMAQIAPEDRERVLALTEESARTMTLNHYEYRIDHPTRGRIWVESHSLPYRDPDGGVTWHGVVLDVTERKRAEEAHQRERERLSGLAAAFPAALVTLRQRADGTLECTYASDALPHVFGVDADGLARDASLGFPQIAPEDRAMVLDLMAESARTLQLARCEYRLQHPTRGWVWVEAHSQPQREPDGSLSWHGVLLDVTERKQREEEHRRERERLAAIADAAPGTIGSFRTTRDGTISFPYLSPAIAGTVGLTREQIDADPARAFALVHPDDLPALLGALARSRDDHQPWQREVRIHHPGKGERWVECRATPTIDPDGGVTWHGFIIDVTDRKRAEAELRAERDRFGALVDLLPDAVFVNRAGRVAFCNAAFLRLLGARSPDELIGKAVFELAHPDDHEALRARIERVRTTRRPAEPAEMTVIALDGARRAVRVISTAIGEDEFLVVLHDLSESQRTERLLRSVLESVTDAILTIDERGRIQACNPATSQLFGYARDEMVGRNIGMLMPEAFAREHDAYLATHLRTGTPRIIGENREVLAQRKDGTTFPIELTVSAFRLSGDRHFTGVIRDVTARRRLEEQFRQAHKMEAFGQLAGGVAHDFNNLLTIILGATEFLAHAFRDPGVVPPGEVDLILADIEDAGQRAAALTRQLLAFSRKTVLEPRLLDLNVIVRETEKMLRRLIGEDVRLTTRLASGLDHVHVDPGQLTQVLLNLAVNARDAMPTGGSLSIETAAVRLSEAEAASHGGLAPGSYVKLTVRDTGVGMSAEVKAQLFQPFFTTKAVGKGTGLGLAVVHGVVTQSGGAITVTSEEGRGTSFEILLPAVPVTRTRIDTGPTARPDVTRATVLLVEDDELVRKLAHRALTASGFEVLVAPDGASALATFEQADTPIDLIITDVVMPTMNGRALGEQVRQRVPDVRILYVSGYTDDMLVRHGIEAAEVEFLAKPYTPATLIQAAVRALGRDDGQRGGMS